MMAKDVTRMKNLVSDLLSQVEAKECRALKHRGELRIESVLGATFPIFLPIAALGAPSRSPQPEGPDLS